MRRRLDARTGEIDTIVVNIQKGTAELEKKHVDADVGEQRAADAPAGVINTKHTPQRRKESKKGRKKVADTVSSKVEKIYTMERD